MYAKLNLLLVALILCAVPLVATAQCTSANLKTVATLAKDSLVIDVRPDQINQFKGKSAFKEQAHISLVNMNPFLFSYSLKVDQTEIQDTGFLNFLKLLGSPVTDLIGSVSASSATEKVNATTGGNLQLLIARTAVAPAAPNAACPANSMGDATQAIASLAQVRDLLVKRLNGVRGGPPGLDATVTNTANQYASARSAFKREKDTIFDSSVEAAPLCASANTLHIQLSGAAYPTVPAIQTLLTDIRDFKSVVDELKSSALEYKSEYDSCPARQNGLNYASMLVRLADELAKVATAYETKVTAMLEETKSYDALVQTIVKLNGKEHELLQREYTVQSRYDISALDIIATAVPLGEPLTIPGKPKPAQGLVGEIQSASSAQANSRIVNVGATENAEGVKVFSAHSAHITAQAASSGDKGGGDGGGEGGGESGGAKQIRTSGTIGRRRFEISAGMAFSSLGRREFQPVLGFARNEQGVIIDPETGKPTDERKLTKIVGLSEDTSTRFAPLGMLHYRIPHTENIFASVGFTGKRDDHGVDLEYLFGPSILYRHLFLTFGGYVGKQQKLAGDLFEGAPVDGDIPIRKEYKWGFGFSLTFKIPLGNKQPDR